jgi:PAS domain S-box-containing protein
MNPPPIESMLRAVVAVAPEGVLAVDTEGTIQWVNPMAEKLFAYPVGELMGQPLRSLIPERFRKGHEGHVASYFREPRPRPMGLGLELAALRKDGVEFPVEISLSHVTLPTGPLSVAFVTDITASKLLQTERDRLFELSPDLVCVLWREGSFKQVNPAFAGQAGWSPEELRSRPFETFLHRDDVEDWRKILQRLLAGENVTHFVNRYLCKDGSIRWLEWKAPAQNDPVIYAAARDITEARQSAEAQQRLMVLIDNIPEFVGLVATDGTRRILHVNRAGRELLGLPPLEQLREMTLSTLAIIDPDVEAQLNQDLTTQGHWRGETNLYHYLTREPIPVELSLIPVLYNGGGNVPIAHAAVARDIRERNRTQERLRSLARQLLTAQEEERRRVARDLHDDVTQKLVGMAIELGLLRRQVVPGVAEPKLLELEKQIAAVAEDLRNLAHEIHPGILEHVGLGAALEAFCREVSRQRGIPIHYSARDVPAGIPHEISVTAYRITQEAVANAVKHSGASLVSVVLAGAREPSTTPRLILAVADNGKGFLLSNIQDGPGLGLLSIEERVRLVQGNLTIQSNPGEGSRLEVEIPLP